MRQSLAWTLQFLALVIVTTDIEILEIEVVVIETPHTRIDGVYRFADALFEFVLFDDNRVDAQTGRELYIVDRLQVGRIGYSQEQALAAFYQWQHPVFADQFLINRANDVQIDLDGLEIQQRHPKLV